MLQTLCSTKLLNPSAPWLCSRASFAQRHRSHKSQSSAAMAEILAGLFTSAVIGIAKDKLAAAITEQANLLWNFGDDLEDMNSVLQAISTALQDAERRSAKEKLKPGVLSCLPVARKKIAVANRMKSMRQELMKINKDFRDFNFTQGCTSTSVELHYDVRETSSLLPENPIIGRNGEKQDIIKLLSTCAKNDETVIVPIYGLGGMGKSSLAQLVYNDAQFKEYDHRIWVYVSQDFDLKKIGRSIISQLPIEGSQQNWDMLQLINQCLDNQLRGKKEEKDIELGTPRSMLQVGKKGTTVDVIVTVDVISKDLSGWTEMNNSDIWNESSEDNGDVNTDVD
uniref:Uncharacterized protein n=1 Tax=Setaria viridis TaxID=4556 RepID=A0A4U6TJI5_SETVI|nr:hypothetical protein SEVIR_8G252500v2 [Setaria viridis]